MKLRAVQKTDQDSPVGHPTQQQLCDFATGRLDDDLVDGVARHLSSCAQCQQVVDDPSGDASLVGRLADIAARVPEQVDGILSRSEVETRLPEINLPDLKLVKEIGRGGMGIIYEAQQISLGRRVAIKILSPHLATGQAAKRRFEREARAVASLRHANIVPVFTVGQHAGISYFTMMLIDGQSLDQIVLDWRRDASGTAFDNAETFSIDGLDTDGSQTRGENATQPVASLSSLGIPHPATPEHATLVAQLGIQAADALEFSHQAGILHRDIKPSNLILDSNRTLWVTDFGLAKAAEHEDLTETGDVLGTLRYLAPECLRGEFDRQSDLFSLGVTLYELLAMQSAQPSRDRGKLIERVSEARIEPLDKVAPHVPADLQTVIQKAIHPEPLQRYLSATEFAEDLRRFVMGQPVRARRPTLIDGGRRWLRRNRLVAGLSGVVLFFAVAVVALSLRTSPVSAAVQFVSSQPNVQLRLESADGVVTIVNSKSGQVRLVPGRYSSRLIGGLGLRISHDSFQLAADSIQTLTVEKVDPLTLVAPFTSDEIEKARSLLAESLGRKAVETNSLGMEFSLIPRGECVLGDPRAQTQIVQITRPFFMARHEVNVAQFQQFVQETGYKTVGEKLGTWGMTDGVYERNDRVNWRSPGFEQTANFPATGLAHIDARAFCRWLSKRESRTCRLPTTAEWEYACRAGTTTRFYTGDTITPAQANLRFPGTRNRLTEVGSYPPNPFGLFDMHGSAIEMCNDPPRRYVPEPVQNPGRSLHGTEPPVGSARDVAWWDVPENAGAFPPLSQDANSAGVGGIIGEKNANSAAVGFGFRVLCEIAPKEGPLVPPSPEDQAEDVASRAVIPNPVEPGMKQWQIAEIVNAWSRRLSSPAVGKDSSNATLVLIPPGNFQMGLSDDLILPDRQASRKLRQHPVRLTKPFYIGRHEITVGQYRQFVDETGYVPSSEQFGAIAFEMADGTFRENLKIRWNQPGYPLADDQPVTCVNAIDAETFCQWLTAKEQTTYRLPTCAEWEYVCRAATQTPTHYGDRVTNRQGLYWSFTAPANRPAQVGSYPANGFGICDMPGNVREWTADSALAYEPDVAVNDPFQKPSGPNDRRWVRDGGWLSHSFRLHSHYAAPEPGASFRIVELGFRVVREIVPSETASQPATLRPVAIATNDEVSTPPATETSASNTPDESSQLDHIVTDSPDWLSSPFGLAEIEAARGLLSDRDGLDPTLSTSVGMNLQLVPPGDFVMRAESSMKFRLYEIPHHQVRMTKPFYISETEVTVDQFRRFAAASGYRSAAEDGKGELSIWNWSGWANSADRSWQSPGYANKAEFPVTCVTTQDAEAFCNWLSQVEGRRFRLPTEAEWEYACRAGTETDFQFGNRLNSNRAYFAPVGDSPHERPIPVGSFAPNAFGLFDMHGNVWELCHDGPRIYESTSVSDPSGPHTTAGGMPRILRGGGFRWVSDYASSSHHRVIAVKQAWLDAGFRIVSEISD
tara:strand:+ start:2226 stop:6674 length:4449 start_codon:yes stop_codon:yes gene_type:complete